MSQPTNTVPVTVYATSSQQPRTRWGSQQQSTSLAAGGIIFISAGMNMAQSVSMNIAQSVALGFRDHFRFSWFIGVIIGVVIAAPLSNAIHKKFMMAFSSLLILIGGIIFTSAPNEYQSLLAGRYLNGIAVGFATIAFLIHASEVASNTQRGSSLAIEQYSYCFGIAIQVIYVSLWSSVDFPANRLHGILDIIFALIAAIFVYYFTESPIYYIRQGDEAAALDCLSHLQRPLGITNATHARLEEHKIYVRENENYTLVESLKRGLLPLVKMIFFRSMMVAFCFSLPLNAALEWSLLVNNISWPSIVMACLRVFGAVIAVCLVDGLGRKLPSLLFAVIVGGLTIAIAAIFDSSSLFDSTQMSVVTSLSLLTQFFAGLYVPFTSVYLAEAFPMTVKPYLIGVCVIVEQLIHVIIVCCYSPLPNNTYESLLAQGILIVVAVVMLCVTLPETRKTTLKEAQDRFRHLLNLKMM